MIERTETLSDVVVWVTISTIVIWLWLLYITVCIMNETRKKIFNIIKNEWTDQIEK